MGYKKIIHTFIILVLIVLIISAVSVDAKADAGEERTIYLSATEYDYPPFSVTGSGEADGFSVELLKAVAKEMGITVTFKIDQWSVLKEELKNDKSIEEVYGRQIAKLRKDGLLEMEGDFLRLTEKGIDLSNYALADFLF